MRLRAVALALRGPPAMSRSTLWAVIGAVKKMESGVFHSLHHRKEGIRLAETFQHFVHTSIDHPYSLARNVLTSDSTVDGHRRPMNESSFLAAEKKDDAGDLLGLRPLCEVGLGHRLPVCVGVDDAREH